MKMFALKLALIIAIAFSGCAPFIEVTDLNSVAKEELTASNSVKIYEGNSEYPEVHKSFGQISANSCRFLLWDPPATEDNAFAQLKIKAYRLNADAVVLVTCVSTGTSLSTNCWESVNCSGKAVKFKAD